MQSEEIMSSSPEHFNVSEPIHREFGASMHSSWRKRAMVMAGTSLAWLLLSVDSLWRHLPHGVAILSMSLGLAGIALAILHLGKRNESQQQISVAWLIALLCVLYLAFAVLYPRSLQHDLKGGSDREDAINVALHAIAHHVYPYSQRTYLGDPITPLPGALALASPFYLLGHVAWQNLVWIGFFFYFCSQYFRYRATAFFFLLIFVLLAPANLSDFTAGGDYLVNLIYVIAAVCVCFWSYKQGALSVVLAGIMLGIVLPSRALYAPVVVPLFASSVQRTSWVRSLWLFSIALVVAVAIAAPVFSPHPIYHLLEQLHLQSIKLRALPPAFHAEWTLPGLAMLTGAAAFLTKMDMRKLLLLFSISSAIMLVPPIVGLVAVAGRPVYELDYLAICVVPFVLWMLSYYEDLSPSRARVLPAV